MDNNNLSLDARKSQSCDCLEGEFPVNLEVEPPCEKSFLTNNHPTTSQKNALPNWESDENYTGEQDESIQSNAPINSADNADPTKLRNQRDLENGSSTAKSKKEPTPGSFPVDYSNKHFPTNSSTSDKIFLKTNKKSNASETENPSIPLNLIEEILKKNLPKNEVNKLLNCFKPKSDSESVEQQKATSSSPKEEYPPTSSSQNADTKEKSSGELALKSGAASESRETKQSQKKKGKSLLPWEISRLQENLTDFVKGDGELGSRRSRSRAIQSPATFIKSVDHQPASKRNRKATVNKYKSTTFITSLTSEKSFISNGSSDSPSGKAKIKMEKLRRPGNDSEQEEENKTLASDDEYFNCKTCCKRVKGIIDHYVNEHPYIEISFVTMSKNEWKLISNQDSAIVPAHHQVNPDLLSWIPTRPSFTSPVGCKLCPFQTCKRSELVEHVLIHALPSSCTYRCTLCGFIKNGFFDMLDHIASHTGEFRYHCNYCSVRFAYLADIKSHLKSVHESLDGIGYTTPSPVVSGHLWIYGFVCMTCRYFQMTEERLLRHLELHEKCNGYSKVSLINLIQPESEGENQIKIPDDPENNKIQTCFSSQTMKAKDIKQTPQKRRYTSKDGFLEEEIPCKLGKKVGTIHELSVDSVGSRSQNVDRRIIPFFTVTIAKNEDSFSYSLSDDLAKFAVQFKDEETYKEMLDRNIKISFQVKTVEADEDVAANRKEPEAKSLDFRKNKQAKEQMESIAKESYPKATNSALDLSKQEPEDNQEGLRGIDLYVCGNIDCDQKADTLANFKKHVLACSRDPEVFTCRHCGIIKKSVSQLLSHLSIHGVKRYLCGICPYRSCYSSNVRVHMKKRHQISVVDEIVVEPEEKEENVIYVFHPRC